MKNQSSLPQWRSLCIMALAALMYFGFWTIATDAQASQYKGSVDRIEISSVPPEKKSKIDSAVFPHDLHADAVMAAGKDCTACHRVSDDGRINFAFLDAQDFEGNALKDYYHETCVACHTVAKKGNPPMLASCRTCHSGPAESYDPNVVVDFMIGLHDLHMFSAGVMPASDEDDQNCSACHHSVDENLKRVPLAETPDRGCADCHKFAFERDDFISENPQFANVPSLQTVSHLSCVGCHMDLNLEPLKCSGCHGGHEFNVPFDTSASQSILKVPSLAQGTESSATKAN